MSTELSMIEELTLLGLFRAEEKSQSLTESELKQELKPFLGGQNPDFPSILARLANSGFVAEMPRGKRQRSTRWRLEVDGRGALTTRIGKPGKGSWKQRAARVLTAIRTLSLEPRVAAALVKHNSLTAYFLAKRLGEDFQLSTSLESLAELVAATDLQIPNGKPDTIWRTLFQRGTANPTAGVVKGLSFAEQVLTASSRAKKGWFGPQKLFIHRAWEAWRAEGKERAMELPQFKERLLSALRTGELGLTRADFTATLDPADLATAEIRDGIDTFHFLTCEQEEQK